MFSAGDVTIRHESKPTLCAVTKQDVVDVKDVVTPEQQLYLGMLFDATTEVRLLEQHVEYPVAHTDERVAGSDEEKDEPDAKLLRNAAMVDMRTVKGNVYDGCELRSPQPAVDSSVQLVNPYGEGALYHISITPRSLVQYEPFFGEFAVYEALDGGTKLRKVTENLRVDVNTEENHQIVKRIEQDDYSGVESRDCVVRLNELVDKKRRFYGVLTLYKMAEYDMEDVKALYRDKNENRGLDASGGLLDGEKKERRKLDRRREQVFTKAVYKFYRQHAFTAIAEMKAEERTYQMWLYKEAVRSEEDLQRLVEKVMTGKARPTGIKTWEMVLERVKDMAPLRLYDSSGYEVKRAVGEDGGRCVLLLDSFDRHHENGMFFTDFVNNVYIYPKELTIAHDKRRTTHVIYCYIRREDTKFHREDTYLPLFYSGEQARASFMRRACSSVCVNEKGDTYMDEMKARLPIVLTPQHHVLFVIQEVLLTNETGQPMEKMVVNSYFAFMPFIQMGKLIQNGEQTVPVYDGLPYENYITTKPSDIGDRRVQTLRFGIRVVSSVHTQSPNVHGLLSALYTNYTSSVHIESAFEEVRHDAQSGTADRDILHTLPVLVDVIFGLFHTARGRAGSISESGNAFKYFIELAQIVVGSGLVPGGASPTLPFELYEKYYLTNKTNRTPVFLPLLRGVCTFFCNFLAAKKINRMDGLFELKYLETTLEILPVVLQMVFKSLVLYLDGAKMIGQYDRMAADETYCKPFNGQLRVFVRVLAQFLRLRIQSRASTYVSTANQAVTQFLVALLRVYSRRGVMECLDIYVSTLCCVEEPETGTVFLARPRTSRATVSAVSDDQSMKDWKRVQILKADVLRAFTYFPYYFSCNVPRLTPSTSGSDYFTMAFAHHFLAAYIQRQYVYMLKSGGCVAKMALYSMIEEAAMMDNDPRYQQPIEKAAIAEYHAYVLDYAIDHDDEVVKGWRTVDIKEDYEEHPTEAATPRLTQQSLSRTSSFARRSRTPTGNCVERRQSVNPLSSPSPSSAGVMGHIGVNEVRHFYLYIVWVIKNMDIRALSNIISRDTSERVAGLLKLCTAAIRELRSLAKDKEALLGDVTESQQHAQQAVLSVVSTSSSHECGVSLIDMQTQRKCDSVDANRNIVDTALMVILEVCAHCFTKRFVHSSVVMPQLTRLVLELFEVEPIQPSFRYFMAFLRKAVAENPEYVLRTNPSFCSDVVSGIVDLCGNPSACIRKHATSVLYLLAKTNFEMDNNVDCIRILHVFVPLGGITH